MSYTLVHDVADVDLTRHALIEASAGTGKTYTLENLVVRLLKERPDITIEKILMVTFTEKATSELKGRIQEKLQQEIRSAGGGQDHNGYVQKIKETLDAFDTASIYTIHGFCHTVLTDFAFENGSLFKNEVVDDGPIFEALMKEQMRKDWPQIHGQHLPEMLKIAGFNSRKDKFLSLVINIARRVYRPGVGDEIKPDPGDRDLAELRSAAIAQVMALKALVGNPPSFSEGFGRLNINKRSKASLIEKVVLPLENYLSQIDESRFDLTELVDLITRIQDVESSKRKGIQCLVPEKWLKKGNNIEVCPNLEAIAEGLEVLADVLVRLTYNLAIDAVRRLQTDAARVKRQNGWISYDDMLEHVSSALQSDRSSALLRNLRSRYKVAFVDEFQDTDPVQWRIFRKLFVDRSAGSDDNILVLIGDPKQAIYAFRGADVFAYLEARNEMAQLAAAGKAGLYSLATNWRSMPQLVAAFNELFGRAAWFRPHAEASPFEIGYQGSGSPPETDLPAFLAADSSSRPALNVVDLRGSKSPKLAKPVLARFIAREIRHLVDRGGIRIQSGRNEPRRLDFGDICILVRGKPDASFLEPDLTALGIPYSFYKKPGLFLSDEALYLSLVCHAVLDPGSIPNVKKALLTPFFTWGPGDLFAYETLPVSHPLKSLLFHWNDLARRRSWGRLFQSLIDDSGLLWRESESSDWDRQSTNYRQMFEHLEAVAYRKNLDFRGLAALLDSYRKQTAGAEDDADIHQIETEAKKVQIMTMHVSKGLQFPVVFMAGGLTRPFVENYHVYHEFDAADPAAGIRKIIDLSKSYGVEKHADEKLDEDRRLYYVALTRAQFKLYVPFFPATSNHAWIGPVCRFVATAISEAFPETPDPAAVGWIDAADPDAVAYQDDIVPDPDAVSETMLDRYRPLLPRSKNFQSRKIMLESFTSLQEKRTREAELSGPAPGFTAVREKEREDDEGFAPVDTDSVSAVHGDDEIPGGPEIGSMFHDIFEHIDFEAVVTGPDDLLANRGTAKLIGRTMDEHRVDRRWSTRVARLVVDTLTTPVNVGEAQFVLGQIGPADRIHEVEFYYPFAAAGRRSLNIPDVEVVAGPRGFIRGFVDLVFRYGGKFFIADWKSNRLDGGYGQAALDECMSGAGYHLQYKLYTIALLRWLGHVLGDRAEPADRFGGIFYFFLRGMSPGNGDGVYFVPPAEVGTLDQLESEIAGLLSGKSGASGLKKRPV